MQQVYVRWPRFGFGTLLELLKTFLVDMESVENGEEGDRLGFTLFWPVKVSTLAAYFVSALLVFGVKTARKEDNGDTESDASGWDFAICMIAPVAFISITWGTRFFEDLALEKIAGASWPDTTTDAVDRFLPLRAGSGSPSFDEAGATGFAASLFASDNQGIVTNGGREHYAEVSSASPYDSLRRRNDVARKEKSRPSGKNDYKISQLFDHAAHLAGLLAMAAVNYDANPRTRDNIKEIFKDWNLDYRTVAEWEYLMREEEGHPPGLVVAAEQWLSDLRARRESSRPVIARLLEVLGRVAIGLTLRGRVLDPHPFNPATAEPLPDVEIRGGETASKTNANGEYVLEGTFIFGEQNVEVGREGVDPLTLRVTVNRTGAEEVSILVRDPNSGTDYAQVTHRGDVTITTVIDVNLSDLRLLVHKLRGKVFWPDSRVVNDLNYQGTPLAGKRVYALPLAEGEIQTQRPSNTSAWAAWKNRPGVLHSRRPGRYAQDERTAHDGDFEIKFIDLSVNRRYFVWVESLDPVTNLEIPEYAVRTFHRELRELSGSRADLVADVGRPLIDHTYNLTADAVKWGVESLKVVNWRLDTGGEEVRAVRPQRDAKQAYETLQAAGERLTFDPAQKLLSDYRIHCLPLVPIFEALDAQSEHARSARTSLLEDMDTTFPRGHFTGDVRFVLDARGISTAIDLSAGAWDGAWNAAQADASRQRRRCELLEKTFILSPQIPSAHLPLPIDARWRFDAITLADYALISIPAPPPPGQAVVANRTLDSDWAPVLQRVIPRLAGLAAGRHLLLAPGHGFYAQPGNAAAVPANWRSTRGCYNLHAGEDENDAYLAAEVNKITQRNGMRVSSVRELDDFTKPARIHTAANTFVAAAAPDFIRLWQQNPVYFVGTLEVDEIAAGTLAPANAVVIGSNLGQTAGDKDDHGIAVRYGLARRLAGGANPIDAYLAIHTNASGANCAGGAAGRGTSAYFWSVQMAVGNPAEANTMGEGLAPACATV